MLGPLEDEVPAQVREDDEMGHGTLRDGEVRKALLGPPQAPRIAEMKPAFEERGLGGIDAHVPQAAVVPVLSVVPIGAVDDRIETGAEHRHARAAGPLELDRHVGHPARAAAADVAGLGDDERARIAARDLAQQRRERDPARIVVAPFEPAGAHFPLAVVVVVDAEQIEGGGAATELGQQRALEHVPGLPLVFGDLVGTPGELGRVPRRRDMDERLDVEKARARIFGADRLDAEQGGANEAPFRFPADVAMPARPAPAAARSRAGRDG